MKSNTSNPDLTHILEGSCKWNHVLLIISFCWVILELPFLLLRPSHLNSARQICADCVCVCVYACVCVCRGCQVGCIWIIWWDKEAITIRQSSWSGRWQPKKIWGRENVSHVRVLRWVQCALKKKGKQTNKKEDVLFPSTCWGWQHS